MTGVCGKQARHCSLHCCHLPTPACSMLVVSSVIMTSGHFSTKNLGVKYLGTSWINIRHFVRSVSFSDYEPCLFTRFSFFFLNHICRFWENYKKLSVLLLMCLYLDLVLVFPKRYSICSCAADGRWNWIGKVVKERRSCSVQRFFFMASRAGIFVLKS